MGGSWGVWGLVMFHGGGFCLWGGTADPGVCPACYGGPMVHRSSAHTQQRRREKQQEREAQEEFEAACRWAGEQAELGIDVWDPDWEQH